MDKLKQLSKRIMTFVLATVMIVTVSGCKNSATLPDTSATADSPDSLSTAVNKEDLTTIVIYRNSYWMLEDTQRKAVQDEINAYIKDKIGVQINMREILNTEYSTKLNLAIASSDDVDLMWTACWCNITGTDDLVKDNAVYNLTDMIKKYQSLYESMPEKVWQSSTYNNNIYFVPIYKEIAEGYDIMCKTSLAESMGWDLSSVTKLSDLTPFLEQAKKAGIQYPYTCQNTAYYNKYYMDSYDFIETYAGISKTGDSTKILNLIDTKEYKEYCELMYRWAQAGYINQTESKKNTDLTLCYTDDYAFGLWTEVPNNQPACSERYSADMTLMPVTSKWISSNGALGSCYAVSANSKKADACLKFLELLYTDQTLADLWTWGIEGENYTKNTEGKVVRNDENTSYVHDVWETNTIKAPSLLAEEPDNKVELYDEFNSAGIPSPAMGFRFDSTNVEAEYAAVANAEIEFGYLLETGFIDPQTGIPEYVDALNNAGLQTILNEMQAQYDTWLAAK